MKMTNRVQDIIVATVLLLLGAVWTWLVIDTIRPGQGAGDIGARAFPLVFGALLMVLSGVLLLSALPRSDREDNTFVGDMEIPKSSRLDWVPALLVLGQICLYGFLLEKIGFVLATPIIVLLAMAVSLRERSPVKLLGMSLGLTVGSWMLFEKVLGIYLANGTWLNLG